MNLLTTTTPATAPATSTAPSGTAVHPAGSSLPSARPHLVAVPDLVASPSEAGEDGSLVAEYGLLAVVAATVTGVLISWAGSGALASFFGQLLDHARSLVVS